VKIKGDDFIMKIKLRKTLGDPYQPEIKAIMRLIETQSQQSQAELLRRTKNAKNTDK
jgi:hypothetical protein